MFLKLIKIVENNFGFLLSAFAILAFSMPQYFLWGENLTDELMMFALFLGCLKINFEELLHLKNNFKKLILFVLFNLVLLPSIFYFISPFLNQDTRLGIFLLLAISGAVVTPLVAGFLNLKILWSISFVTLTSVLMPLTLPILIKLFFSISLKISFLEMMIFLAKIIFIPALLIIFLKKYLPKTTNQILKVSGLIGAIDMSIFLGILVAVNQKFLALNLFTFDAILILGLLFLMFIIRFLIGFFMPYENKKERWTNSLMFGNMNNGLVILLAAKFFNSQVLFVVLLSEIPWVVAQPIFQKIYQIYYKTK